MVDALQLEVKNLRTEVDVLSRVFLFVDLEHLGNAVSVRCMAGVGEGGETCGTIEQEYEDAFAIGVREEVGDIELHDASTSRSCDESADEGAFAPDSTTAALESKVQNIESQLSTLASRSAAVEALLEGIQAGRSSTASVIAATCCSNIPAASSPPISAADLGPIEHMGRVAADIVEAPVSHGALKDFAATMREMSQKLRQSRTS